MAKGRTTRSSKKGNSPKKTKKGSGKSKSQKSKESPEAAAAADVTSPNIPSLADLATAASADSMDAEQLVDELNLGTKSFDSQFSMGGMSLGSAASWKHGEDAFRVGGHGGVGLGGGISVALQNDAELMLSLSRSHDEDNSLSGVLRPLGPAGDDASREGAEDTSHDGIVGVDLPLPNGKNQIPAESRDDFSSSIMRSAPGHPAELRDGPSPLPKGSDAASITSTGSGKSSGAGSYSSRGHPPPPPHMGGSPMRGPPRRGASPYGPPPPGYRGGPYSYGGGPYYRGPPPPPHGPLPPGYRGGPYGPPPPLSGPPSSSSKSGGTPGSKKGAGPKGKGAKPYGPPPYPDYRGPPPGPYGRGPPPPPPPHYYGRHPHGPPPPHGPYGYGPRPGPPPPPGSSSASVGSSKSSPAPKNFATDAPSIDSTPSKDGSVHTADTKGTDSTPNKDGNEADNDSSKDGKDKDGGSATKKLQESPTPGTIATVDSTISTGTHETISTTGSLRKKRTYDGLSQAGSSDSASVHSSPHRHPHPGYHGYGPYPPPHPHHRHPGAPYPPPPPYHGRGRHPYGPPPPHMPHRRYHGSPAGPESSPGHGPMEMRQHRRSNSDASTLSSHSFSGVSFDPIVGKESKEIGDDESMESVSKRQRTKEPPSPGGRSLSSLTRAKLNKMTVEDKSIDGKEGNDKKIFLPKLDMATTTGNDLVDTAKTPICKNTKIKKEDDDDKKDDTFDFSPEQVASSVTKKTPKAKPETDSNIASAFRSVNAADNINTPALYSKRTDSLSFDFGDMIKDDPLLNSQLKNHAAYTPLPSVGSALGDKDGVGINPSFSNIGPQLSWGISPNIGDIAEWADSAIKGPKVPPPIQPSLSADGKDMAPTISPMAIGGSGSTENGEFAPSLSFWQDEDVDAAIGNGSVMKEDKESILMHLSTLSPENINTGPVFFDKSMPPPPPGRTTEERKNNKGQHNGQTPGPYSKAGRGRPGWPMPPPSSAPWAMQSPHPGMPRYPFVSPPSSHGPQGDRVRNLRGRVPHGGPPMHIPPHLMHHHHPQMSPMVGGPPPKPGMWSPPHPAHLRSPPHPMASPQHMRPPMDLTPSKRRCAPLKPPLPTKFQGDYDKAKATPVPEFTNLVNFPMYVSGKHGRGVPETMRCCVMCGQACPCAASGKVKRPPPNAKLGGKDNKHGHYAVIPAQNKGLCTSCDVNVWVICQNGLEVKWCKGCKNFRQWATFGDKGLATKCVRCRERQREKYALQKEAKDNARAKKK